MRQVLAIAAILAMYGLIAYSIGIPLPPQPWLSLIGLAVLETVLLVYNQPVAERLVGEVLKPGYTPRQNELDRTVQISRFQRAYVLLVMLLSTCSITAVLCCQTGVWATPHDMQLFALLFIDGLQMVGVLIVAGGEFALPPREIQVLCRD